MSNKYLAIARADKCDEFYTRWEDIERELQAYLEYDPDVFRGKIILCPCDDPEWSNFTKFFALHFQDYGLKKLVSTSFAVESKIYKDHYQLTLFEQDNPKFDPDKTRTHGKIFVLDSEDINRDGVVNIDDLKWDYLQGDGDFRSEEVKKLRDEADIIITNPPFSLFREFVPWIVEADKKFLIIGNLNAITYKNVFPLIKEHKMWLGATFSSGVRKFHVPEGYSRKAAGCEYDPDCRPLLCVNTARWFTNLKHEHCNQPLPLMTMADNLKFSRHKKIRGKVAYDKYDNFDAIEVPFTDAIPSDYDGLMGVPISFLNKYCPEQFEIVGHTGDRHLTTKLYQQCTRVNNNGTRKISTGLNSAAVLKVDNPAEYNTYYIVDGEYFIAKYKRLIIRHIKKQGEENAQTD